MKKNNEHVEGPGSAVIPITITLLLVAFTWLLLGFMHKKLYVDPLDTTAPPPAPAVTR